LQAFLDLLFIDSCTIPAEQEFYYVGGYRILPAVFAHQVFPNYIPVKYRSCQFIEGVKLHTYSSPPTVVACFASTRPDGSSKTRLTVVPSRESSATRSPTRPVESICLGVVILEFGSLGFVRRSAMTSALLALTATRQRIPNH